MAELKIECPNWCGGKIKVESSYSKKEDCTNITIHSCNKCNKDLQLWQIKYMLNIREVD